MKQYDLNSLTEFIESKLFRYLNVCSLLIMDFDGVLVHGYFDPDFWFGTISAHSLNQLEQMLKTNTKLWIFTNRKHFGKWGNYIKHIVQIYKKNNINVKIYKSRLDFINNGDYKDKYCIITDAQKKERSSTQFLQTVLSQNKQVIYIASQEKPFRYHDLNMVKSVNNSNNLIFINIKR